MKLTLKTLFPLSLLILALLGTSMVKAQSAPTPTRITTQAATGSVGKPVSLIARLFAGSTAVSGELLTFYVIDSDGDVTTCSARTNAAGLATVQYVPPVSGAAYFYPYFAGDARYAASSSGGVLTVK